MTQHQSLGGCHSGSIDTEILSTVPDSDGRDSGCGVDLQPRIAAIRSQARRAQARCGRLRALAIGAIALVSLTSVGDALSTQDFLYPGKIAFQSEAFPSFSDMASYTSAVKKALLTKSIKRTATGDWMFHFVAFLHKQKAPQATRVNLAFFRLNKLVDFVEFTVEANARTLLSKAKLTKDRGFNPGDKIRAKVTVLVRRGKADREIVLADTGRTFVLE